MLAVLFFPLISRLNPFGTTTVQRNTDSRGPSGPTKLPDATGVIDSAILSPLSFSLPPRSLSN